MHIRTVANSHCFRAEHLHVKPGKGAAFVRTKLKNAVTNNTVDKTFRAGESVASATVEKKEFQYTYADGNEVVMHWQATPLHTFTRHAIPHVFLMFFPYMLPAKVTVTADLTRKCCRHVATMLQLCTFFATCTPTYVSCKRPPMCPANACTA